MDGKSWIDSVERKFKGRGAIKYLADGEYCDDNDEISSALTSRLLDSIAESDILSYMATELKDEENCADVWEKIAKVLQSSDLTLLRILRDWQKFFRLRCETLEDFPQFYSDLRSVTSNLRTANSVAIGDDAFIKAFLSGAISVKELSQTTKEFLTGGKKGYTEIMDLIQVEYNLMDSCHTLQDNVKPTKSALRRAKNNDLPPSSYATPEKAHNQTGALTKFSPNTGNLIPNAYYKQLKGWFEASRVPAKECTEEQINYLSTFSWIHPISQGSTPMVWPCRSQEGISA